MSTIPWQIPDGVKVTEKTFIKHNQNLIKTSYEAGMYLREIRASITEFSKANNLGLKISYDRVTRAYREIEFEDIPQPKITNKSSPASQPKPEPVTSQETEENEPLAIAPKMKNVRKEFGLRVRPEEELF